MHLTVTAHDQPQRLHRLDLRRCKPGPTRRGVERAIDNTDASSRVRILEAPLR